MELTASSLHVFLIRSQLQELLGKIVVFIQLQG